MNNNSSTLKIIAWVIGLILLARFWDKHKKAAKGDPLDPLNYSPVSNVNWQNLVQEFTGVQDYRKEQIRMIADNVYQAMRGIGAKVEDFKSEMIKIQTDEEFELLNRSFGTRKRKDLKEWIDKERRITDEVKTYVNDVYELRNMKSTI